MHMHKYTKEIVIIRRKVENQQHFCVENKKTQGQNIKPLFRLGGLEKAHNKGSQTMQMCTVKLRED
jgi:hypothetical protein